MVKLKNATPSLELVVSQKIKNENISFKRSLGTLPGYVFDNSDHAEQFLSVFSNFLCY